MPYGYTGKIAWANLTTGNITMESPSDEILKKYVGGRGLAVKILWDRFGKRWRSLDPLGPENLLLTLSGPVTGYIPGMRVCVSGKSPASNGIVGSTAGGEFPIEMKCAGFDGIIVEGKADSPVYILATDGKVEIRDATTLWGLDGKETIKMLNKEVRALLKERDKRYGLWKEPAMLYIGPAGENRVRNAVVMQKWTHACGYGGYGAVMGSKNLKALVAKGTGPLPDVANPEKVIAMLTKMDDSVFAGQASNLWGTGAGAYTTGFEASAEPVRNWQEEWHNDDRISVINLETKNWVKRYWADYGCPRACVKLAVVKAGPCKGAIDDNPDYELGAYCGANFGIFNTDEVIYVAAMIDDLGLSGVNSANTMAFAAELFQRGILTKEDLGGIEPKWGDAIAIGELAKLISYRKAIGDVLAEGTYRAAKKISEMKGVDCMQYAVQYKGIEPGAHGIRTGKHFPYLGYALSTQGGDHTSIPRFPVSEAGAAAGDSLVFCNMTGVARGELMWEFLNAVTGYDMTDEKWMNFNGRSIIQIQRAALLLGGPDIVWNPNEDDDNPERWYVPLPNGPFKGIAPKRNDLMEERKKLYQWMG
ncbi:MAG: Aldehyde ferredoxin oxidoreductase [Thermoproteota archaeon]|nr:Aldehyde ferredoxin oxidoreductase [Thermoproteota archaeon]